MPVGWMPIRPNVTFDLVSHWRPPQAGAALWGWARRSKANPAPRCALRPLLDFILPSRCIELVLDGLSNNFLGLLGDAVMEETPHQRALDLPEHLSVELPQPRLQLI